MDTKRKGRFSPFNNNSDSCPSFLDHSPSFYKDIGWKPSLLDWDKPLFSQYTSSFERILARAKKTEEKSRKLINRTESKNQSSICRAKLIPENATIRKEYVKCGKTPCYHEKHGPYYYAYWKDPATKKIKKKYIGQYFQSVSEEKRAR
jgi:hypothetical protein